MILPDTSVWVDHFRGLDTPLDSANAAASKWLLHPFVFGELLLGGLPKHPGLIEKLDRLTPAPPVSPAEANAFIQWAKLTGTGIGHVDAHLLVTARTATAKILTSDQRLLAQAARLGLAYLP